jgi:hypothetical protein
MSKVAGWIVPVATGMQGRFSRENNDCTVRAFKNATEIEYREAHAICKVYGRKENAGMMLGPYHKLLTDNGFRCIGAYGTTHGAKLMRVVDHTIPSYKGMTLANAMKFMQNGSFIVSIRGHVFAVVDGDLIDQGPERASASVAAIWKKVE